MQYRPTAAELMEALGDLLGDEVIDAVPEHLRHRVRVAHNLSQILEREHRLGDDAARRETELIHGLLGDDHDDHDESSADGVSSMAGTGDGATADGDLLELRAQLSQQLRTSDDPGFERAAWEALVIITGDDLAIAKPGHDGWKGT